VLVLTIYDLRAIHLNYLGVHYNCIKKFFYVDVCLNMCSSAIRYAWFCTSVCIFSCTTYMLKFFSMVTSAYTFVICSIKINQSISSSSVYIILFSRYLVLLLVH